MSGARKLFDAFRPRLFSVRFFAIVFPLGMAFFLFMITAGLREFRDIAMSSVADKAFGICNMIAFNVAPSLVFGDSEATEEIVSGSNRFNDVIFLIVRGASGKDVASYGKKARAEDLDYERMLKGIVSADGKTYSISLPVIHKDKEIGRVFVGLSLDDVHVRIALFRKKLLWSGAALILIGGISIFLLSFLVTRPLRRVSDAARRIAQGDMSQRVPVRTLDEAGHLASDFNSMVDALNQARDNLEAKVEERTLELRDEIGERKKAEEALRESEENFRNMVQTMGEGVGIVSESEGFLFANDAAGDIFGITGGPMNGRNLQEFVTPEGFARIRKQTELRRRGEKGSYEIEVLRPDGGKRTILLTAIPRFGPGRAYEGALCVFTDITERKVSERKLREVNEKLEQTVSELEQRSAEISLLSELYDAYQACRDEKDILAITGRYGSKLFPESTGILYLFKPSGNILDAAAGWGKAVTDGDFLFPDDCWALRRGKVHLSDNPADSPVCPHVEARGWSGEPYVCAPLAARGTVTGLLHIRFSSAAAEGGSTSFFGRIKKGLAQNFAERVALALDSQRLRDTLKQQSIRDPLTGLFNRRFMEETLEKEIAKATRSGIPLGVIMIDIDKFKTFNDSFGHEAGDEMLKAIGTFLSTSVRSGDDVCRYGGEEFTILLPGASLETATERARRLCEDIRPVRAVFRGQAIGPVTLSLGVAAFPLHGSSGIDVVQAADMALFRAKKEGRNRAVAAE
jgi:diguanylate cyclase (GGDEF)-like protein/PAS domain S-box-containing protein